MNLFPVIHALYIDPTAVSITLTSIFGAAIVIGTSLTIWWRKAKKKVAKTLHIDENAHKEVEDELVIHEEADGSFSETKDGADEIKKD